MNEVMIVAAVSVAVPAIAGAVMAVASALESRTPAPAEVRALKRDR